VLLAATIEVGFIRISPRTGSPAMCRELHDDNRRSVDSAAGKFRFNQFITRLLKSTHLISERNQIIPARFDLKNKGCNLLKGRTPRLCFSPDLFSCMKQRKRQRPKLVCRCWLQ
jgi:hypothetical protein